MTVRRVLGHSRPVYLSLGRGEMGKEVREGCTGPEGHEQAVVRCHDAVDGGDA